VLGRYNFMW